MLVLFVCTGNICRSPMAESVLRQMVEGMDIHVDSAGTGGWHVGERADPRTLSVLARYGLPEPSRARQVRSVDFDEFDHIIAMDEGHVRELSRWQNTDPAKVSLMMDWHPTQVGEDVPDPYYGGPDGFEHIYRMITEACEGFVAHLRREAPSKP